MALQGRQKETMETIGKLYLLYAHVYSIKPHIITHKPLLYLADLGLKIRVLNESSIYPSMPARMHAYTLTYIDINIYMYIKSTEIFVAADMVLGRAVELQTDFCGTLSTQEELRFRV